MFKLKTIVNDSLIDTETIHKISPSYITIICVEVKNISSNIIYVRIYIIYRNYLCF